MDSQRLYAEGRAAAQGAAEASDPSEVEPALDLQGDWLEPELVGGKGSTGSCCHEPVAGFALPFGDVEQKHY